MGLKFTVGASVAQVVTPITGQVVDAKIVDGNSIQYLVRYTDATGAQHERWFAESELQ